MKYEILETTETVTVTTKVRYDFDGVIVEVDVAHFNPKSEAEIAEGIENRAISEQRALAG